jgi:glycerate dehydrogenase
MNIVVLDGHTVNPGDNPWDVLASHGILTVHARTGRDEIIARAQGAAVILTNKTPLTAETLTQLPDLRFVCVLATGFDNVDVAAAGRLGIPVANVPTYSVASVAQHTIALLLELCNRVGMHDRAVHSGEWSGCDDFSFWRGPLTELAGKRLGIVGMGAIGQRVASIAHAMGMEILAYNPRSRNLSVPVPVEWHDLPDIFAAADVVSLHCPATADNRGFVNRELLQTMKRDAIFINTARGVLVVEEDLAWALNAGVIAGAGLDVVGREPILPDNPLLAARDCIITPHIAWATLAARRRLMMIAAANVAAFIRGERLNVVNGALLQSDARMPAGEGNG